MRGELHSMAGVAVDLLDTLPSGPAWLGLIAALEARSGNRKTSNRYPKSAH